FLIAILTLILLQMLARWTGEVFPGAPDYAGYSMAAASFFAFAHALNHGAHIRVSILLNAMGTSGRRIIEVWCFTIATTLAWYFCFYAIKTVWWSYKFNDISQGQDATPIWIPQMVMVIGAIIFAIALTDNLLKTQLSPTDYSAYRALLSGERNQREVTLWVRAPGGKMQKRQVKLGLSDAAFVEVVSGLEAGEEVVTGIVSPNESGQPRRRKVRG
ncbi:MAG: TRAP transporter small permease subunit, partial [Henriciella sp.]|nr:TRAP transporter small permease subunit [Henriciella sp.]